MFAVGTVPYTNRAHLVLRPLRECCKFDFLGSDRIVNKASGAVHRILGQGDEETVRVNRIITKISGAVQRNNNKQACREPQLDWQVVVLQNDGVDTAYLGGGWILVSRGLLGRLDSDAEVAFVLAHQVRTLLSLVHLLGCLIMFDRLHMYYGVFDF